MRIFGTIILSLCVVVVSAQSFTALTWDDLKPQNIVFVDPFEKLTAVQLKNLSAVARVQMLQEHKPENVSETMVADHDSLIIVLQNEGVNVDSLFKVRYEIAELRRQRAETTVESLNGTSAQIPGYLLPLDYSGEKTSEFLLVPWVGACIHTPPPPKNQIVYVKYAEGYSSASQFEAVYIMGQLQTSEKTSELYLTDGSDDISSGYSMKALEIKPFKN